MFDYFIGGTASYNVSETILMRLLQTATLTFFTNFTGHPAASIPAGLADEKYPVGMQIIGKKGADTDVLRASSVLEKLQPWDHIYEICRNR